MVRYLFSASAASEESKEAKTTLNKTFKNCTNCVEWSKGLWYVFICKAILSQLPQITFILTNSKHNRIVEADYLQSTLFHDRLILYVIPQLNKMDIMFVFSIRLIHAFSSLAYVLWRMDYGYYENKLLHITSSLS